MKINKKEFNNYQGNDIILTDINADLEFETYLELQKRSDELVKNLFPNNQQKETLLLALTFIFIGLCIGLSIGISF